MITRLNSALQSKTVYFAAVILLTILFEAVTCIGRFGFNISIKEREAAVKKLTFGIRIHHGYIGLLIIVLVWIQAQSHILGNFNPRPAGVTGWGLLLSDMIHHFIVLYFITGKTEFP